MRKGQSEEALKSFQKVSELQPGNEEALMGQFAMFRDLRRNDDMRVVLNRLIEQKPDDPMRWLRKGMELAEVGQADTALVAFNHLGEMWPDTAWIWIGKGQCLEAMSKYDDAIMAFDRATTMNPQLFDAWNLKGEAQLKAGRYDDAIASCSRAAEMESMIPGVPYYNRACAYALKGEKAKALADLRKALELMPDLKTEAPKDEDLKSLWKDPDFMDLTK